MKLLRLEFEGFAAYWDRHTLRVPGGVSYIVATKVGSDKMDSNGGGKTSLLNALSWGLFGQTPGGASKDKVINEDASEAKVSVYLEGLEVHRGKLRNKSETLTYVDHRVGQKEGGDLTIVQAKLERALGLDFRTFCNTLFLGRSSKTLQFLLAQPAQRMDVLGALVDDDLFQEAGRLMQVDLAVLNEKRGIHLARLNSLVGDERELGNEITETTSKLAQESEQRESREATIKRRMNALSGALAEAQRVLLAEPPGSMESLQHAKVEAQKSVQTMDRILMETSGWRSQPEFEPGSTCPTCRQPVEEHQCGELEKRRVEQRKRHEAATEIRRQTLLKVHDLDMKQNELREFNAKRETARKEVESLTWEYTHLKDELQVPGDGDFLRQHLIKLKAKLQENRAEQAQIQTTLKEIDLRVPRLQTLARGFKSDVRNILFDRLRGALAYYTKHYLYSLAGDEFDVTYPPQSKTGREKFEIILRADGKERDLSTYSEGEVWRACFAILLALRRVLLQASSCKLDFLLVDDPVGGLDDSGIREFGKLLKQLASQEIHTILATIPRKIDVQCDNTIEVIRRGRVSSLKEV